MAKAVAQLTVTPACYGAPGLQSQAPWPMVGLCPMHRGQSPAIAAQTNAKAPGTTWANGVSLTTMARGSAVVSSDGTLYIGSSTGLFRRNLDGSAKWTSAATPGIALGGSPAIGADGTVYYTTTGSSSIVRALTPGTTSPTQKWATTSTVFGGTSSSGPVLSSDGATVFASSQNGKLVALRTAAEGSNPAGSMRWPAPFRTNATSPSPLWTSPAIGTDGTLYIGADNGLYAVDPATGLQITSKSYTTGSPVVRSNPAVGPDGTVYFGTGSGTTPSQGLVAIKNGTFQWKWPASGTAPVILSSPAVGGDGTIYFGTRQVTSTPTAPGQVVALNPNGSVKWTFSVGTNNVDASPAIGADGVVYIGTDDKKVYALKDNGTSTPTTVFPPFTVGTGSTSLVRSALAIGRDGTVYVPTDDAKLWALGPGTCGSSDTTCDGTDNNCNGSIDEGYVPVSTNCGVGACARTGTSSCVNGAVQQNCTPGTPASSDTTCNGVDDNCNGVNDEGYVPVATNCGVGACARTGTSSCVAGAVQSNCTPGTPAPSDTTCNGIDDNCNGANDEGYVASQTSCTRSGCLAHGSLVCQAGATSDTCPTAGVCYQETACADGIDNDGDGKIDCQDSDCAAVPGCITLKLESDAVQVGSTPVTVELRNTYISPIVVTTINYKSNTNPVVTRVGNVSPTSFQVYLQSPTGLSVVADKVTYLVVEEGVWNTGGIKLEAHKFSSTITDHYGSWVGQARSYGQAYTSPVVLGQVMSVNDSRWSTFWCMDGNPANPPSPSSLYVGKQVGMDSATTRNAEDLGYVVIEAQHGLVHGVEFEANLTPGLNGSGNITQYEQSFATSFASPPQTVVATSASMLSAGGGWLYVSGDPSTNSNAIYFMPEGGQGARDAAVRPSYIAFARSVVYPGGTCGDGVISPGEDCDDGNMTTEYCTTAPCQVCDGTCHLSAGGSCGDGVLQAGHEYCDTSQPGISCVDPNCGQSAFRLESAMVDVGADWVTVPLLHTYVNPVVVTTINYQNNPTAVITRLRNVSSASFDVSLQSPGGSTPVVDKVTYLVVEDGVWNVAGLKLEAHHFTGSTLSWTYPVHRVSDRRVYGQAYTSPVVFGQVMSMNDTRWSIFWSSDGGSAAPSVTNLYVGRHIGYNTGYDRLPEDVGYIVAERGHGSLASVPYEFGSTASRIAGIGNGWATYAQPFATAFAMAPQILNATAADVTSIGGWAYATGVPPANAVSAFVTLDNNGSVRDASAYVSYAAFETRIAYPAVAVCGDGVVGPGENCDDGNAITEYCSGGTACQVCDATCHLAAGGSCGDGVLQGAHEYCDTAQPGVSCADPGCSSAGFRFEDGVIDAGAQPVTVRFRHSYVSPVVVTTVQYQNNTLPVVPRVRVVGSQSFELYLQNPSGAAPVTDHVSYMVVEEGVWNVGGVKLEAHRVTGEATAAQQHWVADRREYGQSYIQPIVLGQVMSTNDSQWSVFWSMDGNPPNPPSSTNLYVGKDIGNETWVNAFAKRSPEILGYVVFEAGHGTLDGTAFEAAAAASVSGIGNGGAPYHRNFTNPFATAPVAIATGTGMVDVRGSWAIFYGNPATTTTTLNLSMDRDRLDQGARDSGATAVAYFATEHAIDTCSPAAPCDNGVGGCLSDADCVAPLTCGFGIGPEFGKPANVGVCWNPQICATLDTTNCGTPSSICGPNCCKSSCGAAGTDDGCGGTCQTCVPGADTDKDGVDDCTEQNDGKTWTNPIVSNAPCGNGQLDAGEVCDTLLSPLCAADCSASSAPIACSDPIDCPAGQTCGFGNGPAFGQDPSLNFCWPLDPCGLDPSQSCGTQNAACGGCTCRPNCRNKACGDDPSDGCGGSCPGLCGALQPGCHSDTDCPADYICAPNAGPRYGLASGVNVCVPVLCNDYIPSRMACGTPSDPCGVCPVSPNAPQPDTTCNPSCEAGSFCSTNGQCAQQVALVQPVPLATAEPDAPTSEVGKIPGTFAVTQNGTAEYTIPIEVPPGRAGMEPRLALHYDSAAGDGFVGHGWSLTGLPAITRCPKTYATDGVASGVSGTGLDAFCLGSDRLVAINGGTYGEDGTEYRTEIDTFTKVVSYGPKSAADGSYLGGPRFFKAWTKEGRILTFGSEGSSGPGSRRIAGTVTLAWYVSVFEDHSGNMMNVAYEGWSRELFGATQQIRSDIEENRPIAIYYTSTASTSSTRKIAFSYDNTKRNLMPRRYIAGAEMKISSPLKKIEVYVEGQRVRRYDLEPRQVGATWLLDSVKLCVPSSAGDKCLPPTRFTYDETGSELSDVVATDTDESNPDFIDGTRSTVFDFDGDGNDDLLQQIPSSPNTGRNLLRLSGGASTVGAGRVFRASVAPDVADAQGQGDLSGSLAACFRFQVLDFNEDGRDDLFAECARDQTGFQPGAAPRYIFVSSDGLAGPSNAAGIGFEATLVDDAGATPGPSFLTTMMDLDTDGRPDYVRVISTAACPLQPCGLYGIQWRKNLGPSQGVGQLDNLTWLGSANDFATGDYDGDGIPDLAILNTDGQWVIARVASGQLQTFESLAPQQIVNRQLPYIPVDVNGDGLQDRVFYPSSVFWSTADTPEAGQRMFFDPARQEYGEPYFDLFANRGQGFKVNSWYPNPDLYFYNEYCDNIQAGCTASTATPTWFSMDRDNDGREELYLAPGPQQAGTHWIEHKPLGDGGDPTWTATESTLPFLRRGVSAFDTMSPDSCGYYRWSGPANRSGPISYRCGDVNLAASYWQGWQSPVVMDVNGDGVKDLVTRTGADLSPSLELRLAQSRTRHRLTMVTDGMWQTTGVEYEKAYAGTGTVAYTPGSYCTYPQRCLKRPPYPVVAAHTIQGDGGPYRDPAHPQDVAIQRRFEYSYVDGRVDILGRGFLGFNQRTVKEVVATAPNTWDTRSTTAYAYDNVSYDTGHRTYPKAGRPLLIAETRVTAGNELTNNVDTTHVNLTANTWQLHTSAAGLPYTALDQTRRTETESVGGGGSVVLSDVTETSAGYDGYGNTLGTDALWAAPNALVARVRVLYDSSFVGEWQISLPKQVDIESWTGEDLEQIQILVDHYNGQGLPELITRSGRVPGEPLTPKLVVDPDYDSYGNVIQLTETEQLVNNSDAPARQTYVTYDDEGYFPRMIENGVHKPAGMPGTTVYYDPRNGKLSYEQDPDGNWQGFVYDGLGRLQWSRDTAGQQTTIGYAQGVDANGPMQVSVTSPGTPDQVTEYNSFGLATLLRETRTPGQETWQEVGYDDFGRLITQGIVHFAGTASPGSVRYAYDELDRVIQEDSPWQDVSGTARTATTVHLYASKAHTANTDVASWLGLANATRVHLVQDPSSYRSVQTLGMRGNVAASIDALGHAATYTYGPFDHLTAISFDGLQTAFTSDELGLMTQLDDPDRGTYRYGRNGFGEVQSFARNPGVSTEQDTTYSFDGLGRTRAMTTPDGTYSWTWDGDGSVQSLIGRLVSKAASSQTVGTSSTSYAYDGPGGALTGIHRVIRGALQGQPQQDEEFDTGISYNPQALPDTITYPASAPLQHVKYSYNTYGQATSVANADPGHSSDPPLWSLGSLDAFGAVSQATYGNGVQVTRTRESRTGLLHLAQATNGATVLQNEGYAYDERGLLAYRGTPDQTFGVLFHYDGLGRLQNSQATFGGGELQSYNYDARGNLTQNPTIDVLTYGGSGYKPNQLASTSDGRSFGYDTYGNQSARNFSGNSGQLLSYSAFDLPVELGDYASGQPSIVTTFKYDADGQRTVRAIDPGDTTTYVGDIFRRDAHAGGVNDYTSVVPLPDGATLEVTTNGSERYHYLHVDHQGSVSAISGASGSLLEARTYAPFGKRDQPTWSTNVTAGYTGQEQERSRALINLRGRMYDPEVGRFLSTDSVLQSAFHIQGLNPYSYVLNSPTNLIDPSGLKPECMTDSGGNEVCSDDEQQGEEMVVTATRLPGEDAQGDGLEPPPPALPPPPFSDEGGAMNADPSPLCSGGTCSPGTPGPGGPLPSLCMTEGGCGQAPSPAPRPTADPRILAFAFGVRMGADYTWGIIEDDLRDTAAAEVGGLAAGKVLSMMLKAGGGKVSKLFLGTTGRRAAGKASRGAKPPDLSPEGAGRSGAFREAKRQNGIPVSEQPSRVTPNLDKRGNLQPGRTYEFDQGPGKDPIRIRDDAAGHNYGPGDPQNRGPHFNDPAGNHYDY